MVGKKASDEMIRESVLGSKHSGRNGRQRCEDARSVQFQGTDGLCNGLDRSKTRERLAPDQNDAAARYIGLFKLEDLDHRIGFVIRNGTSRKHSKAQALTHHVDDCLQAGPLDGAFGESVRASNVRAKVENLVAEAVAASEQ